MQDVPLEIQQLAASPEPADKIDAMMRLVLLCFTGIRRYYEHEMPMAAHSLRVGMQLSRFGDDLTTVLAGFGHDLYEDTDMTAPLLATLFGPKVADLVGVCSLDEALRRSDRQQANEDLFQRVKAHGRPAIAIELVDVADNMWALGGREPNWEQAEKLLDLGRNCPGLGEQSPHVQALSYKLGQLRKEL